MTDFLGSLKAPSPHQALHDARSTTLAPGMARASSVTITARVVIPTSNSTANVNTDQPIPGHGAMLLPNHTAANLLTSSKQQAGLLPSPILQPLPLLLACLPSFLHSQSEAVNSLGEKLLLFSCSNG